MADDALVVRGTDELRARLAGLRNRYPQAQGRMLFNAGEALRDYMVTNYLSGQRLRRITGRLAGGFTTRLVADDTAIVGTAVTYARVQEEGFRGTVSVRSFMRARVRGGQKEIEVRAHSRQMNIRPKYYARDAVRFGAPTAIKAAERQAKLWLEGR